MDVFRQLKEQLEGRDSYTVGEFLNIYEKAIEIMSDKRHKEDHLIQTAKDKLNELINLQE